MNTSDIQGLPPGAVVTPIQGLPPGVSVTPIGGGSAAAPAQQSQPAQSGDLTANTKGEGLYQMQDPNGNPAAIPYSNVPRASSSGYRFASRPEIDKYSADYAADPVNEGAVDRFMDKLPQWVGPALAYHTLKGIGTGVAKTAAGVDSLVRGDKKPLTRPEEVIEQAAATPTDGVAEGLGEAGEAAGEFWTGEGLLNLLGDGAKALPMVERLKQATKIADVLKNSPVLDKLARIGALAVKQGIVGAGQTFVKTGGDTGAAAQSGLLTGASSAVINPIAGAVSGKAGEILDSVRNRTANVGGETAVLPKQPTATPTQAAGQRVIQGNAQDMLGNQLEELNESRTPEQQDGQPSAPYQFKLKGNPDLQYQADKLGRVEGNRIAVSRGRTAPTAGEPVTQQPYVDQGGVRQSPPFGKGAQGGARRFDYPPADVTPAVGETASGSGELTTTDPAVARGHLAATNEIVNSPEFGQMAPEQRQQILSAKADTERQLDEYWQQQDAGRASKGMPGFEKINIPETVRTIGSHTEAADALNKAIVQGYDQIADRAALSGESAQTYTALKNAYQEAEQGVRSASGTEALASAEQKAESAHQDLVKFFDRIGVTPKEVAGLNQGYQTYLTMRDVAKAVDGSFNVNPYLSKNAGLYRGFNGDQLKQNLSALIDKHGMPAVERILGRNGVSALAEVAELNSTRAGASQFGQATNAIAKYLSTIGRRGLQLAGAGAGAMAAHAVGFPGWEGYAAGASLGAGLTEGGIRGTQAVYRTITSNPKIAQNVLFAIKSGARPQNYVPFIAGLIQQDQTERARLQDQGKGEQ